MRDAIIQNLSRTYVTSEAHPPSYRGKVRDVYEDKDQLLIVATDRVSVFDQIVGTIPLKGALLTEQSAFWLGKAAEVVHTHLVTREDPQIQRCLKAQPFKFEIVVRDFLAGSLLREPTQTRGKSYGIIIDPDTKPFHRFPKPQITPSTKASSGNHDEPVSSADIISSGLATKSELDAIYEYALALFNLGSRFAQTQGLILADTKYEFGLWKDKIILIDEIHTADSSRYWLLDSYERNLAQGKEPDMLDKERLRKTLISLGVDPKGSKPIPPLSDTMRIDLAEHYWDLTETLTALPFVAPDLPSSIRVPKAIERLKT